MAAKDNGEAANLRAKYADEAKRYGEEQKDLQAEANRLDAETHMVGRRTDRYDLGEVFLEIALVVTSITLLSKKRGLLVRRDRSGHCRHRHRGQRPDAALTEIGASSRSRHSKPLLSAQRFEGRVGRTKGAHLC